MKKRYLFAGASGIVAGAVATKLLIRPRDVSWPDSLDFIYHPEHSWFTTIDGARIHYQEAGDEKAPPMILIHGFISSNLVWSDVFLPLANAGFRVIAPDLPGYGYSDKPDDAEYTIDAQARAVIGLLNQLRIEKAIIVGASYGGAIAMTVTTTVLRGRRFSSFRQCAAQAMAKSPSSRRPNSSQKMARSPSPSKATPPSALRSTNISWQRGIICWQRQTCIVQ